MKTLVIICLCISIVLGIKLAIYIYRPEPEVQRIVQRQKEEKVIEMDRDIRNYNCLKIRDMEYNILTYCVRKEPLEIKPNVSYVRGYYIPSTNTIWLDKNSPPDRIAHEVFHMADIKYKGRDAETRAYAFQDMFIKLTQVN